MTDHLHPADAVLSRAFNENLDALTIDMIDDYGFHTTNTPMGELRVAHSNGLVACTFEGNVIDTNIWSISILNSGIATQGHCQLEVSSGTELNGSCIIQTFHKARYQAGTPNRFRTVLQLGDIGITGNIRRWGVFDGTNGAFFELNGTQLFARTMKNSVVSYSSSITMALTTNSANYEIYLTNGTVYFAINGKLVATLRASTETWSDTLTLPVYAESTNSDINTECVLKIRVISVQALGTVSAATYWTHIAGAHLVTPLKRGPGRLHDLINNNNSGTLTLYDSLTDANIIAVVDLAKVVGTIHYCVYFQNALSYVTTGDALDITITYE